MEKINPAVVQENEVDNRDNSKLFEVFWVFAISRLRRRERNRNFCRGMDCLKSKISHWDLYGRNHASSFGEVIIKNRRFSKTNGTFCITGLSDFYRNNQKQSIFNGVFLYDSDVSD